MIKLVNIDAPTHLSEKVVNSRIPEFVMDVVSPSNPKVQKPIQKSRNFNLLEKAVCKRNVHSV